MDWIAVFGIALALAMDAFAVSIAVGLQLEHLTARHVFRMAFHFGLFQFLMSILGWWSGRQFAALVSQWDHWVAFGLLVAIGGKMIWQSFQKEVAPKAVDPTRGWSLVSLSLATSIDALAVGLSLAFLDQSIWLAAIVIGLVAGGLSWIGIVGGAYLSRNLTRYGEILGGVILVLLGSRILVTHLAG